MPEAKYGCKEWQEWFHMVHAIQVWLPWTNYHWKTCLFPILFHPVLGRHVAFSRPCLHRMRHQKGADVTFCMLLSGLESQFWYSKAAAARAATEELYFFLNDASNASCDSCITHIQPDMIDYLEKKSISLQIIQCSAQDKDKLFPQSMSNTIC